MSRTRIIKGKLTEVIGKNYKVFSEQKIVDNAVAMITDKGEHNGVIYGPNEEPPKPPILNYPEPILNGDIIFCNGYLSDPKKNATSYLNVFFDIVPDNPLQEPYRGANMSEYKLTDSKDIYTNDELEKHNRQGGGTTYSDNNYVKSEYVRWLFAAKEKFEGYWEGYDNVSKIRYSQIFKDYFHAQGNAHFINGSHGLQSSGAHRVEHGIAQGYAWAQQKWNIKKKQEIEEIKDKNPGALSYSPQYKPVTIVGHSQGAAIAAGVALGVIYYAYEMGWEEAAINIVFLGTHQPQGLYDESYDKFETYYKQDFVSEWVLEFVAEVFTKEKLKQNQGIYEKMNELFNNDTSWKGLLYRAIQFTFPNDRALFVTRMGDIPFVKNACSKSGSFQIGSWFTSKKYLDDAFYEEDGFYFHRRALNKAYNDDGSVNSKHPTYKECVKNYWKVYNEYLNYKKHVKDYPQFEFQKAKAKIPDISILPLRLQNIIYQSVSNFYQTKQNAYLQSELYRKRIKALLAFVSVHEMELQAHFAPVGFMFNEGILSDWDEYQDQTIWDRIKDTGKDLFYKIDYSEGASLQQKREEEKAYVEGEGKSKMIKTNIVKTAGIEKWINQAKEELKVEDNWANNLLDWWNGDKKYDGSGWGYGARKEIAELIGLKDGDNISSLFSLTMHSMLQTGNVDISDSPRLIRKINRDNAFVNREKIIIQEIINDPFYLSKTFNYEYSGKKSLQLGGKRTEGKMFEQFEKFYLPQNFDTWKVAANELTWLLRSIGLNSTAHVEKNGNVTITHQFEDVFDLRPSEDGSRSFEYDMVCMISGFLYHDIAGGNDKIKIKGKWQNSYTPKQLQARLNEKPKSYMEDLQENLMYDAEELKNSLNDGVEELKNSVKSNAKELKNKIGDIID